MTLMQEYGVPVPRSSVATTAEEAEHSFATKFPGGGMYALARGLASRTITHPDLQCVVYAQTVVIVVATWIAYVISGSVVVLVGRPLVWLSGKADVVMKAQILAGGRGLGTFTNGFQGGVHFVTRYVLGAGVE